MTEDWHFNDDTIYDCIILFKHIDQSDISWRHILNNNDVYILWCVLSKYCLYIKKYNLKLIFTEYRWWFIQYWNVIYSKCNFLSFLYRKYFNLNWHLMFPLTLKSWYIFFQYHAILKRRYKAHNDSSFYTKQHFPWKEDKSALIWDHIVVQW